LDLAGLDNPPEDKEGGHRAMDTRQEIVETLVEESVDLAQTPPGTVAASKTKVKVCCVKDH
jgi:hypothetical protein